MNRFAPAYTIHNQAGFTLLEVLITLVLLAFSLSAVVALQMKLHLTEVESYQRSQAIFLVHDLTNRIQASGNSTNADNYITGTGAGDDIGIDDTALDADGDGDCVDDHPTAGPDRDLCEWSNLLKGTSEIFDKGGPDEASAGGITGARGCVERIQAENTPLCIPAIYRVTVAWQGLHETVTPGLACGSSDSYGGASLRRTVSALATIGLPGC